MKSLILKILIQGLSVFLVAALLPGIRVHHFGSALLAGLCLSAVNALVKPLIILLTLPFTLVTLGFFLFLINGFCFWLASVMVPGFEVHGFFSAVFGAMLFTIIGWLLHALISPPSVKIHTYGTSGDDPPPSGIKRVKARVIQS